MKIGFVGFGNMASAMADGWIAAGVAASDMCACAGRYDALVERCEARGMVA
ncbi:MAG: NAD(P)-binding domain-containing protein, partial [Collinsella sp.]